MRVREKPVNSWSTKHSVDSSLGQGKRGEAGDVRTAREGNIAHTGSWGSPAGTASGHRWEAGGAGLLTEARVPAKDEDGGRHWPWGDSVARLTQLSRRAGTPGFRSSQLPSGWRVWPRYSRCGRLTLLAASSSGGLCHQNTSPPPSRKERYHGDQKQPLILGYNVWLGGPSESLRDVPRHSWVSRMAAAGGSSALGQRDL